MGNITQPTCPVILTTNDCYYRDQPIKKLGPVYNITQIFYLSCYAAVFIKLQQIAQE